jgi:RNA-directed DNA polymerase
LEGDIKGCFDAISHQWLLVHIPRDKTMLKHWLKAGYRDRQVFHSTEEGTPQGGIISPVLANMTLDGLEKLLHKAFPRRVMRGGKCHRALVHFIRYADDFILPGRSKVLLEQEVKPLVEQFMRERGRHLSAEKTVITHIEKGFDFLGQNVRKYKAGKQYKLLIKPAQKHVKAFLEKVREVVKVNKAVTAGKLIGKLNPIIRGWATYHRHVVSKEIFHKVDNEIDHTIRKWIRRKHPRKSDEWIAKKYFTTIGGDHWVFHGPLYEEYAVHLLKTAKLPMTRYRKAQGEANPYDLEWESYFEKRLDAHMMATYKGKEWLHRLWKEQHGECLVCHQKITTSTGWHSHPILWKSKGGPDTQENRVLLHPTCHQQVHSQGLTVTKPRPTKRKGRSERLEPDEGEIFMSGS